MDDLHEKRMENRQRCYVIVSFGIFNQPCTIQARILNASGDGILLDSIFPVKRGTTIMLKTDYTQERLPSEFGWALAPNLSLAEIRWLKEVPDQNTLRYHLGAKFFLYH